MALASSFSISLFMVTVSKIATARNFREKQKAEAELEHAKYMREQYGYKDE